MDCSATAGKFYWKGENSYDFDALINNNFPALVFVATVIAKCAFKSRDLPILDKS